MTTQSLPTPPPSWEQLCRHLPAAAAIRAAHSCNSPTLPNQRNQDKWRCNSHSCLECSCPGRTTRQTLLCWQNMLSSTPHWWLWAVASCKGLHVSGATVGLQGSTCCQSSDSPDRVYFECQQVIRAERGRTRTPGDTMNCYASAVAGMHVSLKTNCEESG
jgi:hypothetical protein